jgi:hypothetical protein
MRTLINRRDSFHDDALFNLEVTDRRGTRNLTCYAKVWGAEAFVSQQAAGIQNYYTQADRALSARLQTEAPVKHGDVIMLKGMQYRVHVNGDFSDAAKLIPV